MTARIFSYSGQRAKTSFKFTDKAFVFADLSVNFWPFWWGFTDKAGFLDHLSVKPGPKRLNFYGQTAIFDHFVRNRHFWNSPFTDSMPIFIDSSVNEILPNAVLLNHCTWVRLRAKRRFLRFARYLRSQCFGESKQVEHFFNFLRFCSTFRAARAEFGEPGSQKWVISPVFCLLSGPRTPNLDQPVDKNHTFSPFFVYFWFRAPWIWTSR